MDRGCGGCWHPQAKGRCVSSGGGEGAGTGLYPGYTTSQRRRGGRPGSRLPFEGVTGSGSGGPTWAPSERRLPVAQRPAARLQSTVLGVPGRELDDSSCRLSRTPSSYKASFCTIFCRAGLMTIWGGGDDEELPRSGPGVERGPPEPQGPMALEFPADTSGPMSLPGPQPSSLPFGRTEVLSALSESGAWKGPCQGPG